MPGREGIRTEVLKRRRISDAQVTIRLKIFHDIESSDYMFENWRTGLIVKLAKKGDLSDCTGA